MKDDFLKDSNRRKSVVRWIKEVMDRNNINISEIRILIYNDKHEDAFKKFVSTLKYVMDVESTLKYPIYDTIENHGVNATYKALYKDIILNTMPKGKTPKRIYKIKDIESETTQEIKEEKNIFIGINSKGKRVKGQLNAYVVNGKIQYQLRSLKTGRALTQTDTVKRKIKELEDL